MPTRITKINRIIIAVCIEVKTAGGIGVEVSCIVRGDESTPSGVIVTCIQEIETGFCIEVIASVKNWIVSREIIRN